MLLTAVPHKSTEAKTTSHEKAHAPLLLALLAVHFACLASDPNRLLKSQDQNELTKQVHKKVLPKPVLEFCLPFHFER